MSASRDQLLSALEDELNKVRSKSPSAIKISELAYNVKLWDQEAPKSMTNYLLHSNCPVLKNLDPKKIYSAPEQPGDVNGSGAGIINTLSACKFESSTPSICLLTAGLGSRLWGVSVALGFVKGLTNCIGSQTVLEQTVNQSLLILSQAPKRGEGLVIVSGTDNVYLPTQFLGAGSNKHFSEFTGPDRHIFFFSKRVPVLDDNNKPLSQTLLVALSQLGVMLTKGNDSRPSLFLEKIPPKEIVEVLLKNNQKSIYFNAFTFAFSKECSKRLVELYGHYRLSNGKKLTEVTEKEGVEFDWSTHFIEPLIAEAKSDWMNRYNTSEKQRKMFPNVKDWEMLFEVAQKIKKEFGGPTVIDMGAEAYYVDTGLASDMKQFYEIMLGQTPLEAELKPKLGRYFGLSPAELRQYTQGGGQSFVCRSTFKKPGSTFGKRVVIINSVFEERVDIPDGVVIVDSHIISSKIQVVPEARQGVQDGNNNIMLYSFIQQNPRFKAETEVLNLLPNTVYFSYFWKNPKEGGKLEIKSGLFPINVNPKDKGEVKGSGLVASYYNRETGKTFIERPLYGSDVNFSTLLYSRNVSLTRTLQHISTIHHQTSSGSAAKL
eukprot:TRINITY_DN4113_c0_g1_i1.p1 TRINITY_DN4113_c0_g1~~TRINITY_DN4113_c0_g1_i1.p1  ORF type:complete len:601 (-),score=113.43 TRINITY_DN4113_c0_g1_i1:41-1843(-)